MLPKPIFSCSWLIFLYIFRLCCFSCYHTVGKVDRTPRRVASAHTFHRMGKIILINKIYFMPVRQSECYWECLKFLNVFILIVFVSKVIFLKIIFVSNIIPFISVLYLIIIFYDEVSQQVNTYFRFF